MRERQRVCILVKAQPQPSQKYEETVCAAGITTDGRLLRLYPIPYRRLAKEQQFSRFDWVEMELEPATDDHRPESHRINPDTITIVKPGNRIPPEEKARVWQPFVYDSLDALRKANEETGTSLGIVRLDPNSTRFVIRPAKHDSTQDREASASMFQQAQLFEQSPLPELEQPPHSFEYHFWSGSGTSRVKIHDWEINATYYHYKRRYGGEEDALEHMHAIYGKEIPKQNLHLIFGTIKRYPKQFIIIGVLRTKSDLAKATAQGELF